MKGGHERSHGSQAERGQKSRNGQEVVLFSYKGSGSRLRRVPAVGLGLEESRRVRKTIQSHTNKSGGFFVV